MKKCLWIAILAIIVCLLTVAHADAASVVATGSCGSSVNWLLDSDGGMQITGIGKMAPEIRLVYDPFIHDYVEEPYYTFDDYRSSIKQIVIKEGVTSVSEKAFYNCPAASISLPSTLTEIERYAFAKCVQLTEIVIPTKVTVIPDLAFEQCSSLSTVTLPDTVVEIGSDAFSNCSRLSSINMPAKLSTIKSNAFAVCSSLTEITLPEGVTEIGWYAFSNCSCLSSVTLPKNLRCIADGTFYKCTNLTAITIPAAVERIDAEAFYQCEQLAQLTLAQGSALQYIGEKAFESCSSITAEISFPASLTEIDDRAFYYAGRTTGGLNIEFSEGLTRIGSMAFTESGIRSATLPSSLKTIGSSAFSGSALRSVEIKEGLTAIHSETFYNCSNLESVILPSSLRTIGAYAFAGEDGMWFSSHALKEIVIPEGVTTIMNNAFRNCKSLEKVTLPASLQSIGYDAFAFSKVHSIYYAGSIGDWIKIDKYNNTETSWISSLYDLYTDIHSDYADISEIKADDIVIPDDIEIIPPYAFYSCKSLTSIKFPSNLQAINGYAFSYCSGLTSLTFPESLISIMKYAFRGCSRLTSVSLPNNLESVGEAAFFDCSRLTAITIPNSVNYLDNYAFHSSNLKKVVFLSNWMYPSDYTFNLQAPTTVYCYKDSMMDLWSQHAGFEIVYLERLPGDSNNDGDVNALDALRIFQYVAGWDISIGLEHSDVNGDGTVNHLDGLYILQNSMQQ